MDYSPWSCKESHLSVPITVQAGGRVSESGPEATSRRVFSGMPHAAVPDGGGFRDSIYSGCLSGCGA